MEYDITILDFLLHHHHRAIIVGGTIRRLSISILVLITFSVSEERSPNMKKTIDFLLILLILASMVLSCKDDSSGPGGSGRVSCGGGQGYTVEFCRQVGYYTAGYGVPGKDQITVNCLIGPEGATVSNSTNGTYYCSGTYKLTTFSSATISLGWGGTTYYDQMPQEYTISSPGQGTFSVSFSKKSGGDGNIFLSMSSGSSWMFDVVLVNVNCNSASPKISKVPLDGSDLQKTSLPASKKIIPAKYTQGD